MVESMPQKGSGFFFSINFTVPQLENSDVSKSKKSSIKSSKIIY